MRMQNIRDRLECTLQTAEDVTVAHQLHVAALGTELRDWEEHCSHFSRKACLECPSCSIAAD